jgi:hypothetical protein
MSCVHWLIVVDGDTTTVECHWLQIGIHNYLKVCIKHMIHINMQFEKCKPNPKRITWV